MRSMTRYFWLLVMALIAIGSGVALYTLRQTSPFLLSDNNTESLWPPPLIRQESERKATSTIIIAVGDIMTSRGVDTKMRQHGDDYPFAALTPFLSGADITFGNLETPITSGPPVPTESMTFHARPGTESALARAGFDVVSLANNHTPNYGHQGLLDTFRYLRQQGIMYSGAGETLAAALQPAIIERNGIRFAFTAFNDSDVVPTKYGATAETSGTAIMTADNLRTAMESARQQADVIIVSMHSGTEYLPLANQRQVTFAHLAIDLGADVVIGHHPHVVQNIERYKDKLIFYSLGNFVFDQMFSEATRSGLAVKLLFSDKKLQAVELYPIKIYDYAQPRLLPLDEAGDIRQRLILEVATSTQSQSAAWRIDN